MIELTDKEIMKFVNYVPKASTVSIKVKYREPMQSWNPIMVTKVAVDTFHRGDSEELAGRLFDLSLTHGIEGMERIPHAFPARSDSCIMYDITMDEVGSQDTNITPDLIECISRLLQEET